MTLTKQLKPMGKHRDFMLLCQEPGRIPRSPQWGGTYQEPTVGVAG